jgi:WD40 repeat protein
MGTLRFRHGGAVTFVGYIDGGKQIVTACSDGILRVWEANSGKLVRRIGKGQANDANAGLWAVSGAYYGAGGSSSVALSPDGKIVAAYIANATVQLWEIETGKEIRSVTPGGPAQAGIGGRGVIAGVSLAFSPDSKTLAIKGGDQLIRLWEVETGKEIRQIGKKPDAKFARFGAAGGPPAFSPDGKTIISAGLEFENNRAVPVVRSYDVETGNELRAIKGAQNNFGVSTAAVSRDAKIVALGNHDGTIKLYDEQTGKELRTLGQQQQNVIISTLAFSPDGKTLLTRMSSSPALQSWDVETGKELRTLGDPPAAAGNANVLIRFAGVNVGQALAFTPDGKTLAEGLPSNTIRLWDVATGKEVPPVSGHQGGVNSTSVSPDGKTLTTIGMDNSVRQWELATGKQLSEFKLPAGTANATLSADGKVVAVGGANNALHIFDVASGKETKKIDIPAGGANPFGQMIGGSGGIALSGDGKVVASRGFDATVRCFDTATGKEMTPLAEANANDPNQGVFFAVGGGFGVGGRPTMVFSPDGKVLATVTVGNAAMKGIIINGAAPAAQAPSIRLWNVTLGKPMTRFETPKGVAALAFSPDCRYIATANNDNSLSLWEVITGKECLHIKAKGDQPAQPAPAPPGPGAAVMIGRVQGNLASISVSISPDGRTLASGGADRTIRLWDMATGKELGHFTGHEGGVLDVTFAPNSRTVISGSADTTAMVWDGARFIEKERPTVQLESTQVEDLWKDLMADPEKAYKAIGTLSTAPKQAVTLIGERVKPAKGVDPKVVEQLIKDLEDNNFQTREKAKTELEKLGELAQPALQKVLEGLPDLQTRRAVEKLLEQLVSGEAPPPEIVRTLRSVKVLAQVATPEARQVLETLAKGAAGDKLTREAESALKRMSK